VQILDEETPDDTDPALETMNKKQRTGDVTGLSEASQFAEHDLMLEHRATP